MQGSIQKCHKRNRANIKCVMLAKTLILDKIIIKQIKMYKNISKVIGLETRY